jgi:gluconokinase
MMAANAVPPTSEFGFNGFMQKRGWRDPATPGLEQQRAEAGLAHRTDLVTFFDLMDTEEGRAP